MYWKALKDAQGFINFIYQLLVYKVVLILIESALLSIRERKKQQARSRVITVKVYL
jgi:hypothetical protein